MKRVCAFCVSLLFVPMSSGQGVQPPPSVHPPVAGFGKKADVPPATAERAAINGKITELNTTLNNFTLLEGNGRSTLLQVRPQSIISINRKSIGSLPELKKGDVCTVRVTGNIIDRADCKRT